MERHAERLPPANDRRALPAVALGILVAVVPFLLVPSPGSGGPITFAVRLMQFIAVLAGLGVVASGVYSYRTGNLRPAVTAATAVIGLGIVGMAGGLVEVTGGPLVPIWAWLLAATIVVGFSLAVTERFVDGDPR